MDSRLSLKLEEIEVQIKKLQEMECHYYSLEASEKAIYSKVFLNSKGKNIEERKANAYSTKEWGSFIGALTFAKSEFNKERRTYELRLKSFDAEYLSLKLDEAQIKRQV